MFKQAKQAGQCMGTWEGHAKPVRALAVLDNGLILSGSFDETIKCWKIDERGQAKCIGTWEGHTSYVYALAVLDNGFVLSGSRDSTIKCWKVDETGKAQCIGSWKGHTESVRALAVLDNGLVLSGGQDRTIKCWKVDKTGQAQCVGTWEEHAGDINALVVLDNGFVLSASKDKTIKCWKVDETGQARCMGTWEGHAGFVNVLAVLDNGFVLSGSDDKTIKCWQVDKTGQARCTSTWKGHTSWVNALAVLDNGFVISGSGDNTIKYWKVDETGKAISTWKGHTDYVTALAVLENGFILSTSFDNTIKCWKGVPIPEAVQEKKKAARQERKLGFEKRLAQQDKQAKQSQAKKLLPSGGSSSSSHASSVSSSSALQASASSGRQVSQGERDASSVIAKEAGRCISTWEGHAKAVKALAVLDNGFVISGSQDVTIKCWKVDETGQAQCLSTWRGHGDSVYALAVLDNGFVLSGSEDKTIKCWKINETGQAQCIGTWQEHTGTVYALAVLDNGFVISGSKDDTIKCWKVDEAGKAQCIGTWLGHRGGVRALTLLGNGFVLSGSEDKTIKCWEVDETGQAQCIGTWQGHTEPVYALAMLENGFVFSGGGFGDNTIKCWEVDETGQAQCIGTWEKHTGSVYALAVLDNGFVVSGSFDETIKCWEVDETGKTKCIGTWKGHTSSVTALAVLDNGFVVSGSFDETIKCWKGVPVPQAVQAMKVEEEVSVPTPSSASSSSASKKSRSEEESKEESVRKKERAGKEKKEKRTKKKKEKKESDGKKKKSSRRHRDSEAALPTLPKGEVKALHGYLAPADSGQLSLQSGEKLTLLSDGGNWWRCRNKSGVEGVVPSNYVERVQANSPQADVEAALPPLPVTSPSPSQEKRYVKALYAYQSMQPERLSFTVDECFEVVQKMPQSGWCEGVKFDGARGLAPMNYLGVISTEETIQWLSSQQGSGSKGSSSHSQESTSSGSSLGHSTSSGSRHQSHKSKSDVNEEGRPSVNEIPYEELDFTKSKRLGKGGFGEVRRALWNGDEVAVKTLFEDELEPEMKRDFLSEASMMMKLNSPNIVRLFGVTINPYCMVMELLDRGSLHGLLHSKEPLPWSLRHQFAFDIAKGLAFLHKRDVLHRDLKGMNVLLDGRYKAKLSDFGLSRVRKDTLSRQSLAPGFAGTLEWIAPELFQGAKGTKACDVYSYAMTVWEILSRKMPYQSIDKRHPMAMYTIGDMVKSGGREVIPVGTPSVLSDLTARCWAPEPTKRPVMSEVVNLLESNPITDAEFPLVPEKAPSAQQGGGYGVSSGKVGDAAPPPLPSPPPVPGQVPLSGGGYGMVSTNVGRQVPPTSDGVLSGGYAPSMNAPPVPTPGSSAMGGYGASTAAPLPTMSSNPYGFHSTTPSPQRTVPQQSAAPQGGGYGMISVQAGDAAPLPSPPPAPGQAPLSGGGYGMVSTNVGGPVPPTPGGMLSGGYAPSVNTPPVPTTPGSGAMGGYGASMTAAPLPTVSSNPYGFHSGAVSPPQPAVPQQSPVPQGGGYGMDSVQGSAPPPLPPAP